MTEKSPILFSHTLRKYLASRDLEKRVSLTFFLGRKKKGKNEKEKKHVTLLFRILTTQVRWRETFETRDFTFAFLPLSLSALPPSVSLSTHVSTLITFFLPLFNLTSRTSQVKRPLARAQLFRSFSPSIFFYLQLFSLPLSGAILCLYVLRRHYAFVIIVSRFPAFREPCRNNFILSVVFSLSAASSIMLAHKDKMYLDDEDLASNAAKHGIVTGYSRNRCLNRSAP